MATKKRAGTIRGGYERFKRPPTPIPDHVEPEQTPPPADVSEAIAALWEGRHNAEAIRELRDELRAYVKTVAGHDETIESWLKPIARDLPGKLETFSVAITKIAADINGVATSMRDAVSGMSIQLREHHERIEKAEDRGARHEVRLNAIDDEQLPARVGALEQLNVIEEAGVQALEKAAVKRRGVLKLLAGAVGAVVGWFTK